MNSERQKVLRWVSGGFLLFLLIYLYIFTSQKFISACSPVFVGLVIAYPLNIMINWMDRHDPLYNRKILKSRTLHKVLCVLVALIVLLGFIAFVGFYIGPQLTACVIALLDKVPSGIHYLLEQPILSQLIPKDTMAILQEVDWNNWIDHLVSVVNSNDLFQGMTSTATSAISAFSTILFGILFASYFLSGRDRALTTVRRLVRAFVPEDRQEAVFHCGALLNDCFHDFIVCQATQALIIGVSTTVLMWIFRFPYGSMIGVLNGICALLPVIGGYLGAVLGTLMILADAPGMALFFLIFIIVLQNAIGTFVFPRLMNRSLGLPAVWTLAAVMIGYGLGGIIGILIGVPLTAFGYRLVGEKLRQREAVSAGRECSAAGFPPH